MITASAPCQDPCELVEEVTSRIPLPLDAWEITAFLESLGITDDLARQRYGYADVFALADRILVDARGQEPVLLKNETVVPDSEMPTARRLTKLASRAAWVGSPPLAAAVAFFALQFLGPLVGPPASQPVNQAEVVTPLLAPSAAQPIEETDVALPLLSIAAPTDIALPTPAHPSVHVLLDERFTDNLRGWPDDPTMTAWFSREGYRLFAREARRFVAVGVPLAQTVGDVTVGARFRKVGGPPGGGYGVILHYQGPGPRDGLNQGDRYYVLEVGDKAEVGIWRRDVDHWVDLVPWVRSAVVHSGRALNDVQARAHGRRLTLDVNGVEVASVEDDVLSEGDVGVFVGGDGNEVLLQHFVVEVPGD